MTDWTVDYSHSHADYFSGIPLFGLVEYLGPMIAERYCQTIARYELSGRRSRGQVKARATTWSPQLALAAYPRRTHLADPLRTRRFLVPPRTPRSSYSSLTVILINQTTAVFKSSSSKVYCLIAACRGVAPWERARSDAATAISHYLSATLP